MFNNDCLNLENHPAVQAIDAAIEAITQLRESGIKTLPIDVQLWASFCAPVKTSRKEIGQTTTQMPIVAAPSQVARASSMHPTPASLDSAMQLLECEIGKCQLCSLAHTSRPQTQGTRFAPKVMVINGAYMLGERSEAIGSRLEGPAGEMLWKMLNAIQLTPHNTYVTHAIRCPVTGRPSKEAMLRCSEWLKREIRIVCPQAILLLGPYAGATLFPNASSVSLAVGKWMLFEGIPCLSLHHPMRLQLLDETLAKPMKMENWNALKDFKVRFK